MSTTAERDLAEWVLMYDDAIREGSDADAVYHDMVRAARAISPAALRRRIVHELNWLSDERRLNPSDGMPLQNVQQIADRILDAIATDHPRGETDARASSGEG